MRNGGPATAIVDASVDRASPIAARAAYLVNCSTVVVPCWLCSLALQKTHGVTTTPILIWLVLGRFWRARNVNMVTVNAIAFGLVLVGLLLTFHNKSPV